ncbi:MAG: imidazolonepropionase [Candidatus Bathyarchaeota archaeon]|nr:imidazolonepropionase [Candidatus Bathyarchaeota archaeon]
MKKNPKSRKRESVDILIIHAEEMLTLAGSSQTPRTGKQMRDLAIIRDGAVAIREGKIVAVGKTHDVTKTFRGENILNAKGKTVLPGFVDPHTHLVFAGSREDEFQMRIEGASFLEMLNGGDAILKTARETRRARFEKLVERGIERMDTMMAHGTTTVETKSGYGLTTEDEMRILQVTRRINRLHSMCMATTFMGAHAVPFEYKNNVEEYVDILTEEALPKVAQSGMAEFCDVFCERGIFSLEQTKRILVKAKNLGLKPKIHADHMSMFGGTEIAADIGTISADHLNYASAEGVKAMAEKGVVAVLLPVSTFSMLMTRYPDARLMIEYGVPVALGTDFNAGNWTLNQQLVIAMACHLMHITPAEAITAATINAAHAICRAGEVGSLEVGKRADVAVLNVPNHRFLGYSLGVNLVDKVIANGRLVVDREKRVEPIFMNKME